MILSGWPEVGSAACTAATTPWQAPAVRAAAMRWLAVSMAMTSNSALSFGGTDSKGRQAEAVDKTGRSPGPENTPPDESGRRENGAGLPESNPWKSTTDAAA
eukprot:scaffold671818_cov34-Prasinocladus_malaysianus.AAC.1